MELPNDSSSMASSSRQASYTVEETMDVFCDEDTLGMGEDEEFDLDRQLCSESEESSPQICHIQHQQPTSTHSSLGASLRKERAQRSLRHLLMPIITAVLSLVDIVMDCYLVASHWHQGDTNWAVYTLCVVLFSMIIVDVVSASFYFSDQRDSNKTEWMKRIKLPVVRPWFYAFHLILCGRFVRCFQIFRTVRKVRGIKKKKIKKSLIAFSVIACIFLSCMR
ncbi:uncharacterized protein [Montipora capricornis]|uniref:uncharacterized protein isoform X2 n=1 Tax=Montipora capricornis TaxID=246305 RepID=UPI0035F205C2